MKVEHTPPPSEDRSNFLGAVKVLAEVTDNLESIRNEVIQELGAQAVEEANQLTTYTGITLPQEVLEDAESINSYAAEVEDLGEELSYDEELELDGDVARDASNYLGKVNDRQREKKELCHGDPDLELKFELSKAMTQEERDINLARYQKLNNDL